MAAMRAVAMWAAVRAGSIGCPACCGRCCPASSADGAEQAASTAIVIAANTTPQARPAGLNVMGAPPNPPRRRIAQGLRTKERGKGRARRKPEPLSSPHPTRDPRMPGHSQFDLLRQRRFLPYFVVQVLGSFNDNVYRQAIIGLLAFMAVGSSE